MSTVLTISIENSGKGYVTGTQKVTLNKEHGLYPLSFYTFFVDITVNDLGEVISAIPVDGKTGLDFNVNDLVFIEPVSTTTELCLLRITAVQP